MILPSLPYYLRAAMAAWGVSPLKWRIFRYTHWSGSSAKKVMATSCCSSWCPVLSTNSVSWHRSGCTDTQHTSSDQNYVHFCKETKISALIVVWSDCVWIISGFSQFSSPAFCKMFSNVSWSEAEINHNSELSFVSTSKFKCFWILMLHEVFCKRYRGLC